MKVMAYTMINLREFCGAKNSPPVTQQKIDGLAHAINCSVESIPLLLDFDVRFINAIRVIGVGEMEATPLVECRRIPVDSPKLGPVCTPAGAISGRNRLQLGLKRHAVTQQRTTVRRALLATRSPGRTAAVQTHV
jgi:hypothetical protein